MERSAIDQQSGATESLGRRPSELAARETSNPAQIESVTLPPFFALSPGWQELLARVRALLASAAHSH
jgi:hypothetical protein